MRWECGPTKPSCTNPSPMNAAVISNGETRVLSISTEGFLHHMKSAALGKIRQGFILQQRFRETRFGEIERFAQQFKMVRAVRTAGEKKITASRRHHAGFSRNCRAVVPVSGSVTLSTLAWTGGAAKVQTDARQAARALSKRDAPKKPSQKNTNHFASPDRNGDNQLGETTLSGSIPAFFTSLLSPQHCASSKFSSSSFSSFAMDKPPGVIDTSGVCQSLEMDGWTADVPETSPPRQGWTRPALAIPNGEEFTASRCKIPTTRQLASAPQAWAVQTPPNLIKTDAQLFNACLACTAECEELHGRQKTRGRYFVRSPAKEYSNRLPEDRQLCATVADCAAGHVSSFKRSVSAACDHQPVTQVRDRIFANNK